MSVGELGQCSEGQQGRGLGAKGREQSYVRACLCVRAQDNRDSLNMDRGQSSPI
jgi:hypothetical protein